MKDDKMKAEVTGPDEDCDVWLNLERPGRVKSINLGHPDQPIAHAALSAAGKEADVSCTPALSDEGEAADLASLTDGELIMHYETTAPDDPQVDRIANEMQERGLDYVREEHAPVSGDGVSERPSGERRRKLPSSRQQPAA